MEELKETVWEYYQHNKRELPWRNKPFNSYHILVSEFMLQQTQVSRVIPKYIEFLRLFPDIHALAGASLGDVLRAWSGLGYNSRAKNLHEAAVQLKDKAYWRVSDLEACKGIGKNTAAAIVVYSYNQPLVFIETNIRTVYIHHFFGDKESVDDKQLVPLVDESIDKEHPRDFYYALMDYGTYLKKTIGNAGRQSKHYSKQPRFEGSLRQLRGEVLRRLGKSKLHFSRLAEEISDERLSIVLGTLEKEGLISHEKDIYTLD